MKNALALIFAAAILGPWPARPDSPDSVEFSPFGKVTLYQPAAAPRHVALFLSGDGGWNQGVVDMARTLALQGALVLGIDFPQYLRSLEASSEACAYPAGDLERLAHFIEARLGFPAYLRPVLIGYSSGATAAYATLVQSPPGTFAGGVVLGFCPDLPARKPWCRGAGLSSTPRKDGKGVDFLPGTHPIDPLVVLQGEIDQVCDPAATRHFLASMPDAQVVMLPRVGHGYSVERNWMPQYLDAWHRVTTAAAPPAAAAEAVADLPLTVVPATSGDGRLLAVMLSGDGGWAGIDKAVAGALAARGVEVVGWDSLRYFWQARTPDGAAADLARVMRHFTAADARDSVVLIGYSQGADTMPFMANRLPPDLAGAVKRVVLIGPGRTATFEFHVSTWLGKEPSGLPTAPEIARLAGKLVCLFGADEEVSACRDLDRHQFQVVEFAGGHHLGGDYDALARAILDRIE
jgi:type IV secretory pathway VirJ component